MNESLFPAEIWDRIIWYLVNDGNKVSTETPTLGLFKKIMEKCQVSKRWLFLVRDWISVDTLVWGKLGLQQLTLLKPTIIVAWQSHRQFGGQQAEHAQSHPWQQPIRLHILSP